MSENGRGLDETSTTPVENERGDDVFHHRAMSRSTNISSLAIALAKAQGAFKTIEKDKKASIRMKSGGLYEYTFAGLASCLASVRSSLSSNDLAIVQPVEIRASCVVATTLLIHGESGEWISNDYLVMCGSDDAKEVGGIVTYARRYGLLGLLAIAPDDELDEDSREQATTSPQSSTGTKPVDIVEESSNQLDRDWHLFLGHCKGAPLNLSPDEFMTAWFRRMKSTTTKAELSPYASWVAAGTGLKSATVQNVVTDMKKSYDETVKRIRDEESK